MALHRFIHHIANLADFSSLKFNRYNQYESMVLPLVKWLTERGVRFRYGVEGKVNDQLKVVSRIATGTGFDFETGASDTDTAGTTVPTDLNRADAVFQRCGEGVLGNEPVIGADH